MKRILLALTVLCLASPDGFAQKTKIRGFGPGNKQKIAGFGSYADVAARATLSARNSAAAYIRKYDKNNTNSIERNEVSRVSTEVFRAWDLNGDGHVDPTEKVAYDIIKARKNAITQKRAVATIVIDGVKVTASDRSSASSTIRRYDRNRNGKIDPREVPSSWRLDAMGSTDLDKDGTVTLREMMRRTSVNRTASADQKARMALKTAEQQQRENECAALASQILRQFDRNRNKALDGAEVAKSGTDLEAADTNQNGYIISSELTAWLVRQLVSQAGAARTGVPEWFVQNDSNFDGQLMLAEFTRPSNARLMFQFRRYDANGDGIITAAESLAPRTGREVYSQNGESIIEPRIGVTSEILIPEDFIIGDIDVKFAVTHRDPEAMDAYLTAPDGHRIHLFTGVGRKWSGSDFADTTLDDEAPVAIASSKPPFRGSYRPDGVAKAGLDSLKELNGRKTRGLWKFTLQASRTSNAGLMHGWGLVITPALPGQQVPTFVDEKAKATEEAKKRAAEEAAKKAAEDKKKKAEPDVTDKIFDLFGGKPGSSSKGKKPVKNKR